MENIGLAEFEEMVSDSIDTLDPEMLRLLDNVIFLVEEKPADGHQTLGTYNGFSLAERSQYGYGEQPDRITLYLRPLLTISDSEETLKKEIRKTLVHEIGHFYGLSEERIHELGWG